MGNEKQMAEKTLAVCCPCSGSMVLGSGCSSSTGPCLCPVSSKHMNEPGIAVQTIQTYIYCLFVHSVSISPSIWSMLEEWWLTTVLPKENFKMYHLPWVLLLMLSTNSMWLLGFEGEIWVKIFCYFGIRYTQGFYTFLLSSSLIRMPRLYEGSFNYEIFIRRQWMVLCD